MLFNYGTLFLQCQPNMHTIHKNSVTKNNRLFSKKCLQIMFKEYLYGYKVNTTKGAESYNTSVLIKNLRKFEIPLGYKEF